MNEEIAFFLGFESRRVILKVSFTIPGYIPIILNLMKTVTLLIFDTIYMADKSSMSLFPTILLLRNTRTYISSQNNSNVISYIEASVNKTFGFYTIL